MSEMIMNVRGITKTFGGVKALNGVDLHMNRGEILCLAGENGCGKSTLIKIISGFYVPDEGKIAIGGKVYEKLTPRESMKAGVQVVYQDFSVFHNLTVAENVAINSILADGSKAVSRKKMRDIAQSALQRIDVDIPLGTLVEHLSVADKQLVAIARALLENAKIIIFDEPTSALTHKEVNALFRVINQLKEEGLAIMFVSHKLEEVFEICDRIVILNSGNKVIEGDINEFDKRKFVYYMTGKEYNETRLAKAVPTENTTPVLEVKNLSMKNYFEDVSFSVYPGEVLGITGLLGSGRTELALGIYGMRPVTSGEIWINGEQVKIRSVADGLKNKISYIPEDRITEGLFLEQSIERNIVVSSIDKLSSKVGIISRSDMSVEVNKWVSELSIKTSNAKNPVNTLSGGNQQKVVLAKGLSTKPDLIILNGPTVGVDVGSKMDISLLIQKIAQNGVGVILISDDSTEILTNCKRILVIKNGKITGEFRAEEFTDESLYANLIQ